MWNGLVDVIVGAGVDARNLVAPAVAGGQHQHRHLAAVAPPALDDADAVHLRQADIEHDRVVGLGVAEEMAFLAVIGAVDHIARIGKRIRQLPVQVLVILDDEYAHGIIRPVTLWPCRYGRFGRGGKRRPAVGGHDHFGAARALAVLAGHQHDDHADDLAAAVLLRGLGERSAILRGNLFADRIAIGRSRHHLAGVGGRGDRPASAVNAASASRERRRTGEPWIGKLSWRGSSRCRLNAE